MRIVSSFHSTSGASPASARGAASTESARVCAPTYPAKFASDAAISSPDSPSAYIFTFTLSVTSNPLLFLRFWILLMSSRATPSCLSSSVMVISSAIVYNGKETRPRSGRWRGLPAPARPRRRPPPVFGRPR